MGQEEIEAYQGIAIMNLNGGCLIVLVLPAQREHLHQWWE